MRRMKVGLAAVAVCALVLVAGASGGERVAADRYDDCLKKATTTLAILKCNDTEYKRVDAELNRVYKELVAKLSPARRALLVKAEQRWIAFRDAECTFSASVAAGGTLEGVIYGGCLIDLTPKRTKELRVYLKQPA